MGNFLALLETPLTLKHLLIGLTTYAVITCLKRTAEWALDRRYEKSVISGFEKRRPTSKEQRVKKAMYNPKLHRSGENKW